MNTAQDTEKVLLLTVEQVCDSLQISRTTLHKLTKEGKLNPIRLTKGSVRYSLSNLQQFINTANTPK